MIMCIHVAHNSVFSKHKIFKTDFGNPEAPTSPKENTLIKQKVLCIEETNCCSFCAMVLENSGLSDRGGRAGH